MGNALMRGRVLDPDAVAMADKWRGQRRQYLMDRLRSGKITMKERRELRWKWGVTTEGVLSG